MRQVGWSGTSFPVGFAQLCFRLLEEAAERKLQARRLASLWAWDAEMILPRNRTESFRQSVIKFSFPPAACCLCRAKAKGSPRELSKWKRRRSAIEMLRGAVVSLARGEAVRW